MAKSVMLIKPDCQIFFLSFDRSVNGGFLSFGRCIFARDYPLVLATYRLCCRFGGGSNCEILLERLRLIGNGRVNRSFCSMASDSVRLDLVNGTSMGRCFFVFFFFFFSFFPGDPLKRVNRVE